MSYFFLASAALVWGGSFAVGKALVSRVDPFAVAWARFILASAAFGAGEAALWVWRRGTGRSPERAAGVRPTWKDYALLGLTGVFAYNAFFFYGLTFTTATESSLITASSPVVVAVIGLVFMGELLSARKGSGIVLSVAGVGLIILGAAEAGSPAGGGAATAAAGAALAGAGPLGGRLLGDLLMLGGVLSWAAYSALGKRVLARTTPFKATARAVYWGALFFTLAMVARRGPLFVREVGAWLGPDELWGLGYLAVVCTVFGFVAWYRGLTATDVSGAAVFLNLVPVSSLAIAALALGERPAWPQLVGGALVLVGVYLVSTAPERQVKLPVAEESGPP